jgi:hypothetical protein
VKWKEGEGEERGRAGNMKEEGRSEWGSRGRGGRRCKIYIVRSSNLRIEKVINNYLKHTKDAPTSPISYGRSLWK